MSFFECNLTEICNVYQPRTISKNKMIESGKYHVYGANGIIGKHNEYNHETSEIVMACRGATCGALNITAPYSWINGNAMVIQPKNKSYILQKYLYYYLFYADKNGIITGTAQPQITRTNLSAFKILICKKGEQQRIVDKIEELFSELDKGVEELNKVKEQLKIYRQAVLKEAFDGIFEQKLFKDIAQSRLGKMLDRNKNTGTLRPYLRNINVRWLDFDLSDILEIKIEDKEIEKYTAKYNDLLMCEGGEPGRCAIWDKPYDICYQKAIHRIRFGDNYNAKFYMYYFYFMAQTGKLKKHFTGTGIKHLTGDSLKKILVPYTELENQNTIVSKIESKLSTCDKIEQTVNESLQKAESLRQSILKQAFEGKLV